MSLEFASRSAPVRSDDEMSVKTEYQDFDPAKHNPVFYGKMHERVEADEDVMKELDAATSHPSCAGYTFTDKPPETPPSPPPTPPHKDACEYKDVFNLIKNKIVCSAQIILASSVVQRPLMAFHSNKWTQDP